MNLLINGLEILLLWIGGRDFGLNEGFATWMSWYSCDRFYPEWKVWEAYVTVSKMSESTDGRIICNRR